MIALDWPPCDEPSCTAVAAMAGGAALLIFDSEASADWSTLNPHSWKPRGPTSAGSPIAVSVNMSDEQHSLALGLERLLGDRSLRRTLSTSARAWWDLHGRLDVAVSTWGTVLEEAAALSAPARPDGWPGHLDETGTDAVR